MVTGFPKGAPEFYRKIEIAVEPSPEKRGVSVVSKQSVVKNPPPQPSQLGKDGWYSNVSNSEGKL